MVAKRVAAKVRLSFLVLQVEVYVLLSFYVLEIPFLRRKAVQAKVISSRGTNLLLASS